MKGICNAKVILLHTSPHKNGGVRVGGGGAPITPPAISHQRLWSAAFVCFFAFVSLVSLLTTFYLRNFSAATSPYQAIAVHVTAAASSPTPSHVIDALLHYATSSIAGAGGMPEAEIRAIAAVIGRRAPCNLLVFGLGFETPLWRALNPGGRTVFLDESEYYAAYMEEHNPGLEAFGVSYTTRISDLRSLLASAAESRGGDCRPVQNLLFSDCPLALNDLPNHLYEIPWDVILVDGPRGTDPSAPGTMSAIFTAAVMARSQGIAAATAAEVLVHDYQREVDRLCGKEFLCEENVVEITGKLAHFSINRGGGGSDFCFNRTSSLPPSLS